jgi:hypothetical protein
VGAVNEFYRYVTPIFAIKVSLHILPFPVMDISDGAFIAVWRIRKGLVYLLNKIPTAIAVPNS